MATILPEWLRDVIELGVVAFALGLAFMILSILVWKRFDLARQQVIDAADAKIAARDEVWDARSRQQETESKTRLGLMMTEMNELRRELAAERYSRQALERLLQERLGIVVPGPQPPAVHVTVEQGDVNLAGDITGRDKLQGHD